MMQVINFENGINEIKIDSEVLFCKYDAEQKSLSIHTNLYPKIIDNNFNELEKVFLDLEKQIKSLNNHIAKLENKINIIEAVQKQ